VIHIAKGALSLVLIILGLWLALSSDKPIPHTTGIGLVALAVVNALKTILDVYKELSPEYRKKVSQTGHERGRG
jgi:hypothetical protein